jgi:hypothetical protein
VLDKHGCSGGTLSPETVGDTGGDRAWEGAWALAFEEFNSVRKPNADAIADLAVENFHEVTSLLWSSLARTTHIISSLSDSPCVFLPLPSLVDEGSCG